MPPHDQHPNLLALLAGLREDSGDAARLVLADWLDEHGDPVRAAFVRGQCGMTLGDPVPPRPEEWVGPLPPDVTVGFQRGLLHATVPGWRLTAGDLPTGLAAAWRAGWVEGLTLRHPLGGPLADIPAAWLADITTLDLSGAGYWTDAAAGELAGMSTLADVRTLRLGVTRLTEAGLHALRASPHLARLTHIEATGPYLLAAANLDRHLWVGNGRLVLRGVQIGFGELAALAHRPVAEECHTLDLSATGMTETALRGFLGLRPWPTLRRLDLSRNGSLRTLHALSVFPHLPALEHLGLGGCHLTPSAVVAFGRSPHRHALRSLNLRGVNLHGRPGNVLARGDCLPALTRLVVDADRLTANNTRLLRRRLGDGLVLHEGIGDRG